MDFILIPERERELIREGVKHISLIYWRMRKVMVRNK
jgi:hypothetical protein